MTAWNPRRNEVNMDKMTKKIVGAFAAILVIAAAILAVFFIMNNKERTSKPDEVQILLDKDLENAYPETPTELIKLYWRFNKYMYNKAVSDEDLGNLMKQLRKLYDNELLAEESNSYDKMIETFKKDKKNRGDETIVSAVVEKYDDVKVERGENRQNYATVIVAVNTKKKGGKASTFFESFRCRTDSKNKWKILGWKTATQQEAIDAGVH